MIHIGTEIRMLVRVMMRLVGGWLRRRTTKRGVDRALELCDRVPFLFGCLRAGVVDIAAAEVYEPRRVGDLLTSSLFLDEIDNILLHLAILQGQTDLLTGLYAY